MNHQFIQKMVLPIREADQEQREDMTVKNPRRNIILILLVLFFAFLTSFRFILHDDNYSEISRVGEKYKGSIFVKYDGKIYALIPSGGFYLLENADAATFKKLKSENYIERNIGLDKNHVYFGNIPIPDLRPDTFYSIGNGYYSDGISTYFCASNSERNKNLSAPMEVLQMLIYSFSKDKKPQSYIYPYIKIDTTKKLKALERLVLSATDGENIYYKGEILEQADLNTLKELGRNSEYFSDKTNVYYKSKLLPIKNTGKLEIVSSEQGKEFLHDKENGDVLIGNYVFDRRKTPYEVIGKGGSHLYSLLFVTDAGVYFYNDEQEKQERIGENIFIGKIEKITPNVFSDAENMYYLSSYEERSRYWKTWNRLLSRNTVINYLDKKDGWEKIKDINQGMTGTIWKKMENHYYFDNLGVFQGIADTVYKFADRAALESLLSDSGQINSEYIRTLIKNKKLTAVHGKAKLIATIDYRNYDKLMRAGVVTLLLSVGFFLRSRVK